MRLATALLARCLLIACPMAAQAHAHLERADPPEGAVLRSAPHQITLEFSEAARVTMLTIERVGQSPPQKLGPLPGEASARLQVPAPAMAPGSYQLSYRLISADGHIATGSVHFSLAAR